MGLNFLSKNELAVKGNSYVGYLFQMSRKAAQFNRSKAMVKKHFGLLYAYQILQLDST